MGSNNLNTHERKWVTKAYWKCKNEFFLLGNIGGKIYHRKPRSVDDLKSFIRNALQKINEQIDLRQNVCRSVKERLQNCVNCDGKQFEHLY